MTSYIDGSAVFINDFDDGVDELTLDLVRLIKEKILLAAQDAEPSIEVWINSMGGDAHRAFGLVELMEWAKAGGVRVNTIVLAEAASSGSIVAVAGTPGYRRCTRSSLYMMHYGEVDVTANTPVQLQRANDVYQQHFSHITSHYAKHSHLNEKQLKSKMVTDSWHLNAEEAITLGFADGYL